MEIRAEIQAPTEYERWLYRRRVSRLCAYAVIKTSLLVLLIEKIF